jgi:hypothetical protein
MKAKRFSKTGIKTMQMLHKLESKETQRGKKK